MESPVNRSSNITKGFSQNTSQHVSMLVFQMPLSRSQAKLGKLHICDMHVSKMPIFIFIILHFHLIFTQYRQNSSQQTIISQEHMILLNILIFASIKSEQRRRKQNIWYDGDISSQQLGRSPFSLRLYHKSELTTHHSAITFCIGTTPRSRSVMAGTWTGFLLNGKISLDDLSLLNKTLDELTKITFVTTLGFLHGLTSYDDTSAPNNERNLQDWRTLIHRPPL